MKSSNTAYLKEDYLKRKFMATWEELCSILKIPSTIEVTHEDDGLYSGTSYPEVNRRVQRLLRSDEFPDHMDICELIERSNTKHSLGISAGEKTEMARKVFKDVGKIIKSRRIKDYKHHFGSHLTDAVKELDDPAIADEMLLERLKESLREGQGKMESLVEEFVVKQEVELEKGSGSPQGDSCNSNEEDEEEEEEEDEEGQEELVVALEDDDGSDKELSADEMSPPIKRAKLDSNSASPTHQSENGSVGNCSSVEDKEAVGVAEEVELPSSTGITDIMILSSSDSDSDVIICDDV